MGWLLCRHMDEHEQEIELWHHLNPELKETVSKTTVTTFIADLIHIAVELNSNIVESPNNKVTKAHPKKKSDALEYLNRGKTERKKISNLLSKLGPQVNR